MPLAWGLRPSQRGHSQLLAGAPHPPSVPTNRGRVHSEKEGQSLGVPALPKPKEGHSQLMGEGKAIFSPAAGPSAAGGAAQSLSFLLLPDG